MLVVIVLDEVELAVCYSRKFVLEPVWMRGRPSLRQQSIIDTLLMAVSGNVHVDNTNIRCS